MENINTVSIMQWNTLCSQLATTKSFPYANPTDLQWEIRKKRLASYIQKENADFVCMEEIDNPENFKKEVISPANKYTFLFQFKNNHFMGVAIGYDSTKYTLIGRTTLQMPGNEAKELANQITLIGYFENKFTFKKLCIIVTHLKAKGPNEPARLVQIKAILNFVQKNQIKEKGYDVIITGDFNTEPQDSTVNEINKSNLDFKNCFEYNDKSKDNYIEFTTFKIRDKVYKRIIDYMFYSGKGIKCTSAKTATAEVKEDVGYPNENMPSDHLYLVCKFQLL